MNFSVYIHLPYCTQKCPYCDFNVHVVRNIPEQAYLDTLERELGYAADSALWTGRRVSTIFFGGGTPSLFPPAGIGRLLDSLDLRFGLEAHAEITLEANPEDLSNDAGTASAWAAAGVNRLSIGAQSFSGHVLQTLGRAHDPASIAAAIENATATGKLSVSCDLIFAVPDQTIDDWRYDLRRAVACGVDHLSTYNLTYESGTPFTGLRDAGRIQPLSDDAEREHYEAAIELLTDAGLEQYEVSSFAKSGHRCRHNSGYWLWADYLGLGAGAHGFVATVVPTDDDYGMRYENLRQPAVYMSAPLGRWAAHSERLTRNQALNEFVITGLRRRSGIALSAFAARFGEATTELLPGLRELIDAGLLAMDKSTLSLTHSGLLIADDVSAKLLG